MKKPTKALLDLNKIGELNYVAISHNGSLLKDIVISIEILGRYGMCEGRYSKYSKYLDLTPDNKTVARIKLEYKQQLLDWFDSQHGDEL